MSQSVVYRSVAMRVIFAHDVADYMGAFLGGVLKSVVGVPHIVNYAALNGL